MILPGAGTAAVLGSKNVKSVVVRGTGNVKIANPAEFKELCDYMLRELIGGNNNHNVPAVPQSWAEYSAQAAITAGLVRLAVFGD